MNRILATSLLALLLMIGCAYDPADPVYDCLANSAGFPETACQLIEGIESGKFSTFRAITHQFGELYSTNPELLDNPSWKKVIDRFGLKFRNRADSLAGEGSQHYSRAGGLYALASFARPGEPRVDHLAALFRGWTQSPGLPPGNAIETAPAHMLPQMLRRFWFGDSLAHEFADKYLVEPVASRLVDCSELPQLTVADRAFMNSLGLGNCDVDSALATWEHPEVELIAVEVIPVGNHRYRTEVYLRPTKRLIEDLTISLQFELITPELDSGSIRFAPFEIVPDPPSKVWEAGRISVLSQVVELKEATTSVAISLIHPKDGLSLKLAGSEKEMFSVDIPTTINF